MASSAWRTWRSPKGTSVYVPPGRNRGAVLYIFPGIDGFAYGGGITRGHDWFAKILPEGLASIGAVVISRKSDAPWAEVKADAAGGLASLGYSQGRAYALAFSAGGITLLGSALGEPWAKVFLVDPSIPLGFQKTLAAGGTPSGLGPRMEMRFNSRNWGGYKGIQAAMRPLASAINAAGGRAEETTDYHVKFVHDGFAAMLARPNDPSLFGTSGSSTLDAEESEGPVPGRKRRRRALVQRRTVVRGRRRGATTTTWLLVGGGVLALLGILLVLRD
jgi:hypothetical protein